MIFTELLEMVEETYGLEVVERIIRDAELPSKGVYTSVGNYDPAELLSLVSQLSHAVHMPVSDLHVAFGKRIHGVFVRRYGHFFAEAKDAFAFLSGVDQYIHVEVRKLYPDAELPRFRYPVSTPDKLVMEYRSTRPLSDFAYGLIQATVEHYGENLTIEKEDLSAGAGTGARFTLTRN